MTTREDLRAASQIARADAAVTVATVNRLLKHKDSTGSTEHHEVGAQQHPQRGVPGGSSGPQGPTPESEADEKAWEQQSMREDADRYRGDRPTPEMVAEENTRERSNEYEDQGESEPVGMTTNPEKRISYLRDKPVEEWTDEDDNIAVDMARIPGEHSEEADRLHENYVTGGQGPLFEGDESEAPPGDPYGMDYSDPLRNAVAGATIASTEAVLSLHDTPDSPHFEHSGGGAKDQTKYRRNRKRRDATSERSADWRKRFGGDRSHAGEERRGESSDPAVKQTADRARGTVRREKDQVDDLELHEDSHGSTDHHKGSRGGKGYRAYQGERGRERGRTSQDSPSQQTGSEAYRNERSAERGGSSERGPGTV